jgi:hypothetical protein
VISNFVKDSSHFYDSAFGGIWAILIASRLPATWVTTPTCIWGRGKKNGQKKFGKIVDVEKSKIKICKNKSWW